MSEKERKREEKLSAQSAAAGESPMRAVENFWYHYKWVTIAVAFIVVFLIVCIAQMNGKTPCDAHILYTGPAYLDRETCESISASVARASYAMQADTERNPADYTGDGLITVDFNKYVYVPETLADEYRDSDVYFNGLDNQHARGDYNNAIMIGEYVILLIERGLYEETAQSGAFLSWEETLGYRPDRAIDDYGILLSDLPLGSLNGFWQLPDDTVICCRGKSYVNHVNKKVQNEEMYEAETALFRQLVTYTKAKEE